MSAFTLKNELLEIFYKYHKALPKFESLYYEKVLCWLLNHKDEILKEAEKRLRFDTFFEIETNIENEKELSWNEIYNIYESIGKKLTGQFEFSITIFCSIYSGSKVQIRFYPNKDQYQ